MSFRFISKVSLAVVFAAILFVAATAQVLALGSSDGSQSGGSTETKKDKQAKKDQKDQKKLDKEAQKLEDKAEQAAKDLGRDVVFCILAAHTTGVGTAQELKDKFSALTDLPFGQFVAAVIMADRIDKPLDDILSMLTGEDKKSLGQIAKGFDVDVSDLRQGFGEFRSELARSTTNPPTRDCFATTP
jgi:cell division protein ZapA (FtsZ GTPase activity inhibitor)